VTGIGYGPVTFRYIVTNDCGADTATYTIFVKRASDCATNVKDVTSFATKLYPNPSRQNVTFEVPVQGVANILTTDGRILHRMVLKQGANEVILPDSISPGLYLVQVQLADGSLSTMRLILAP
jgi:hypothetical protein